MGTLHHVQIAKQRGGFYESHTHTMSRAGTSPCGTANCTRMCSGTVTDEFSDDYAEDEVEYAAPAEVSVSFINTEALEERELLTFCIVPDEGADEIEIMGIVSSAYVDEVETTVISLPPEDYIIYSQYMEPVRFTIDNKDQVFFITVDCKAHDMLIEIY